MAVKKKRKVAKKRAVKEKKQKPIKHYYRRPPTIQYQQAPQPQDNGLNKLLIENFVSLQKVMTSLSTKLDSLTTQLSKLLELFEISAKSLAEKEFEVEKSNKETNQKLNSLLDQNKTLARAMSLMHERMPIEQYQQRQQMQQAPVQPYAPDLNLSPPPFQQPKINIPNFQNKKVIQEIQETSSLGTPSIMSQQSTSKTEDSFYKKSSEEQEDIPAPPLDYE